MTICRRWFWLLLCLLAQGCSNESVDTRSEAVAVVQSELINALNNTDHTVPVIINFREPVPAPIGFSHRRRAYRKTQESLLSAHREELTVSRRFLHVPAIAGRIRKNAIESLKRDLAVSYIQLDRTGRGCLKESVPAIGGDKVKNLYNLTGKGVRVAVIDSGVATTHPDLMDSIVAQHCFTRNDCPPGRADEGTSAEDDHGHGTNVTGVITSNGTVSSPGFAPDAEIVAVKVDDASNTGLISDWVAGLDWVYDNLSTLKVKVVNISICATENDSDAAQCDSDQPGLARAVKNLVDAGVVVFGASGNMGLTEAMCTPACNTGVIAVAATYDSNVGRQPENGLTFAMNYGFGVIANCSDPTTDFDQIACFSDTPVRVDLVAPGAPMISDDLNGSTATLIGTSQAAPVAAGVAALMLECNPNLTPAEIKQIMIETGIPRVDAKSNRTFPSLRALEAVEAACPNLKNDASVGTAGASGSSGTGTAGEAVGTAGGGGIAGINIGGAAGGPAIGDAGVEGAGEAIGTAGRGGIAGINIGGAAAGPAIGGSGGSVPPPAAGSTPTLTAGNAAQSGTTFVSVAGTESPSGPVAEIYDADQGGCNCSILGRYPERVGRKAGFAVPIGLMLIVFRSRLRRRYIPGRS